tara:strand:- start:83 stop:1090 length:1008 start_codon:yes stop_codon:yes gene_type:complete
MRTCLALLVSLWASALPANEISLQTIDTIAFGSCNSQNKPQPLWSVIKQDHPDIWIWTGDNVYADTQDPALFRRAYERQLSNLDYLDFIDSVPHVTGTWDDHDYGVNDGGSEFPAKELAKAELYRFLGVPKSEPSNSRDGVYRSAQYGTGERTVKVILLDTRWFRDPLEKTSGSNSTYLPNKTGTLLGGAQWRWLEKELKGNTAAVTVIVSSIQLLAQEHRFEKWANFPNERARFLDLLNDYASGKTLVISGDRHAAEISALELSGWKSPLMDVTSSGLTNVWRRKYEETNSLAITDKVIEPNYGLIRINWDKPEDPVVKVSIKGQDGELLGITL